MAQLHGKVGEFDSAQEDWTSYIERLEQYFATNDIADEKRRAILLTVSGPSTYKVIRNLVAPAKPTDKSFEELVKIVRDQYQPKPSAIVQRLKFNTCVRQPGQSVTAFVAELHRLTEFCDFGPTLDEMLRDRLVCRSETRAYSAVFCRKPRSHLQRRLSSHKQLNQQSRTPSSCRLPSLFTLLGNTRTRPHRAPSFLFSRATVVAGITPRTSADSRARCAATVAREVTLPAFVCQSHPETSRPL